MVSISVIDKCFKPPCIGSLILDATLEKKKKKKTFICSFILDAVLQKKKKKQPLFGSLIYSLIWEPGSCCTKKLLGTPSVADNYPWIPLLYE
jgi:hypothetical protein